MTVSGICDEMFWVWNAGILQAEIFKAEPYSTLLVGCAFMAPPPPPIWCIAAEACSLAFGFWPFV